VRLVGQETRPHGPGLLARGRHGDRAAGHHDANEGSYPENARALALNGAEVVYRASYPHPATGNEIFEIQSRARALDNNMYLVAPNMGTYYLFPEETTPIDTFGGRSFIVNYKGQVVGRQDYGAGSTYVGGVIDIEALPDHRA